MPPRQPARVHYMRWQISLHFYIPISDFPWLPRCWLLCSALVQRLTIRESLNQSLSHPTTDRQAALAAHSLPAGNRSNLKFKQPLPTLDGYGEGKLEQKRETASRRLGRSIGKSVKHAGTVAMWHMSMGRFWWKHTYECLLLFMGNRIENVISNENTYAGVTFYPSVLSTIDDEW